MSKHHHHPHEGHHSGTPGQGAARKPLHHDWRFYAAGFFILLGLLAFIFIGAFVPRAPVAPVPVMAPAK